MPKYIKLFEHFIEEAAPYPLDPAKSSLKGLIQLNDTTQYAIFKNGRIYVAVKDGESVKIAPGNVVVTLDSNKPDLQKQLVALGGQLDANASGSIPEPAGGEYKHLAKLHFNLADQATGEPVLQKIVNLLSGIASSSGTAGTAGTSGTSGDKKLNLADQLLGADVAAAFREKIAKETGKPYDAASSVKATFQPKIEAADKELRSKNPEYKKIAQDAEARAKELKLDPATGKDKSGKVDATYAELKNKMSDMLAKEIKV